MFDCGCSDEGVGKPNAALSANSSGSFCHCAFNRNLAKRCQECAHKVRSGITCEEFSSGDYRVVQPVFGGRKLVGASEVIDEDVGIDEYVSHGPILLG